MLGAGESWSAEWEWERSLCDGENAEKSMVLNADDEFVAQFVSIFSPCSTVCNCLIYSTAALKVSTLLIFLFFLPFGTCSRSVSNPILTIFTRFLSLSFLLATAAGCGLGRILCRPCASVRRLQRSASGSFDKTFSGFFRILLAGVSVGNVALTRIYGPVVICIPLLVDVDKVCKGTKLRVVVMALSVILRRATVVWNWRTSKLATMEESDLGLTLGHHLSGDALNTNRPRKLHPPRGWVPH